MEYNNKLASSKNGNMLNTLTSFRFIAALLVYCFHAGLGYTYQTGFLGVSFFFILSGFILAYNYSTRLINKDFSQIKKFYIARIAKIFPIHVLTFLLAIPYYFFIPLNHEPILYVFQAITNLFLIHSFIPFGNVSFNSVSWSLSDELFFYLMFPFIITLISRKFLRLSVRLIIVIILWILLVYSFTIIPVDNNLSKWFVYFFPGTRIFEFLAGVNLGILFLRTRDLLNKLPFHLFSILECVSILLLIFIVFLSPNFNQNLRYGLIYVPFWGSIIFIFAFQKGLFSILMSKKLLVYLGEISFSFYMIHNLVLSYLIFLRNPLNVSLFELSFCFIISIILSCLLYHFYEEPMRKKLKRYLNSKKSIETVFAKNKAL
jgi:peptidoglycan/LPS O-acetylase OafA/YrhL